MKISLKLLLFSCLFFAINLGAAADCPNQSNPNIDVTVVEVNWIDIPFLYINKSSITFSPNGKKLYCVVCNFMKMEVEVWDLKTKQSRLHCIIEDISNVIANFYQGQRCFIREIFNASISPDGKQIIFLLRDYKDQADVMLWNVALGTYSCLAEQKNVDIVGFTPLSNHIVYMRSQKEIEFWDTCPKQFVRKFTFDKNVGPVIASPDSKQIASLSAKLIDLGDFGYCCNYVVNLRELGTEHCICNIHTDIRVRTLAVSPDGKKIVSCSGSNFFDQQTDNAVKLWDVKSGRCIHEFYHDSKVIQAMFSPDGTKIAVSLKNGTIMIYTDLIAKRELKYRKAQFFALACATHQRTGTKSPAKTMTESDFRSICEMCPVTPWTNVFE